MKTKEIELDDIGFIGIGRPITEEESRIASAHIQAYMAKHPAPKRKTAKRGETDKLMRATLAAQTKKPKVASAKLRALDDIGRIGGEREFTEEDARVVSAFIQAEKAKRSVAKKAAKRPSAKRKTKAKARTA